MNMDSATLLSLFTIVYLVCVVRFTIAKDPILKSKRRLQYIYLLICIIICVSFILGMHGRFTNLGGQYWVNDKLIEVNMYNRPLEDGEESFYHELGHDVYYRMNETEQAVWESIKFEDYPSEYAKTSFKENFAVSFSLYVRGVRGGYLPEQQKAFMKRYVAKYIQNLTIIKERNDFDYLSYTKIVMDGNSLRGNMSSLETVTKKINDEVNESWQI